MCPAPDAEPHWFQHGWCADKRETRSPNRDWDTKLKRPGTPAPRSMPLPPVTRSLSARLLVLTILFVMLAEVLIYTPSLGRFRLPYLDDKLAAGHLAALGSEARREGKEWVGTWRARG